MLNSILGVVKVLELRKYETALRGILLYLIGKLNEFI
jgi:hypothetical protein